MMLTDLRAQNMTQMSHHSTSFGWASSEKPATKIQHTVIKGMGNSWKRDTRAAALSIAFAGEVVSAFAPFVSKPVEHRVIQLGRAPSSQEDFGLTLTAGQPDFQKSISSINIEEQSSVEILLNNLGRLKDGWAGEGSLAPTATVMRDMDAVSSMIDGFTCPEVEVDAEDGTVRLAWDKEEGTFSLVFNGRGKVVGVLTPYKDGYPPWTLPVDDELQLSKKLGSEHVADFICA